MTQPDDDLCEPIDKLVEAQRQMIWLYQEERKATKWAEQEQGRLLETIDQLEAEIASLRTSVQPATLAPTGDLAVMANEADRQRELATHWKAEHDKLKEELARLRALPRLGKLTNG